MTEVIIGGTILRAVRGDITEQRVDAVVNAANSSLLGGGGVDGAIHRRGGPTILDDCRQLRTGTMRDGLPSGQAVATTAGELPARRVIHTVGPVWRGGTESEPEVLANAYRSSLEAAIEEALRTVAFPAISTGVYGYPAEAGAEVAIRTVAGLVQQHPNTFDEIRFVLFSEDALQFYRDQLQCWAATLEKSNG